MNARNQNPSPPPYIETALIEPAVQSAFPQMLLTTPKRMKKLKELARGLNVRRMPEGSPSAGALMDAIACGRIVLRRRDDPERREFCTGMNQAGPRSPVGDRRCPGDWD